MPMITDRDNMRHWLAALILVSFFSARLMVLICPGGHHGDSDPAAQGSAYAGHHAPAGESGPERGTQSAPHGDETNCAMLLTCTTPALIGPRVALFALLGEQDVRAPASPDPGADPLSDSETPPPRLA
ncbi:MAG: hypothetical protein ACRERX_20365 [Pseudomonas sp.]